MSIPRGDCDCCHRLVERLTEVEEALWVCDTCLPSSHQCPASRRTDMDITYQNGTPAEVITILERLRTQRFAPRIRVHYGDRETGKCWGYDKCGTVSRSQGYGDHPILIPLLIPTIRSYYGSPIDSSDIVRIEYANKRKGGVMWTHPTFEEYETDA